MNYPKALMYITDRYANLINCLWHTMLILLFFAYLSLLRRSSAVDTLNQGHLMNVSETIVSSAGIFELGFFTPGEPNNFYLGIWYKKYVSGQDERIVIWVANRDQPFSTGTSGASNSSRSCFLTINNNGNLVISDGKGVLTIPVTSISSSRNTSVTLLDSGNLILKEINSDIVLWQSFDHPSDTLVTGMKLGFNLKTGMTWSLISRKSLNDPASGAFLLELDPGRTSQFLILKDSQKYWTSGTWKGNIFQSVPEMVESKVQYRFISNENESYFSIYNMSIVSRIVMDLSGKIKQYAWSNDAQKWILFWEQPRQQCDLYAYCGAFSLCDPSSVPYCQCLQGFRPYSSEQWNLQEWSRGCVRKDDSWKCRKEDGFVVMPNVSLPLYSKSFAVKSAKECEEACWNNCSCSAYAYRSDCEVWHGDLLNVKPADFAGGDLFLRVATSKVQSSGGKRKPRLSLILGVSIALPLLLILSSIAFCLWKRRLKQRGEKEKSQDLLEFDFTNKTKATKNGSSSTSSLLSSGGASGVELPMFSLASVAAATNNFSNENKLGEGGFGPVYKGTLLNGQEVAIKRLSKGSVQGLEELKNETILIAKLQHRNLVRLLGCCIEGEEKILIYEYMANKSLDLFLFDSRNRVKLDWERRIQIIEGIAHGLLYLHQYSRLRIIHRDLKASNILLDGEMNPKISDFGMARIFGGNMSQATTKRIVGTYGYMAPEYAMQGRFSIKSDVFSFGILLLEILSGKKNTSFHLSNSNSNSFSLIGHAWNLWRSERGLEFIDPMLGNSSFSSTSLRYIHVALLCVQEKAIDRPTMSEVIAMLSSDLVGLPLPKQLAFSTGDSAEGSSSTENPAACSLNAMTVSMLNAR